MAILAELFVETQDATYVYNQARCFEQNGRNQEAIDRFREYLRIATHLSKEDAASVQKHIADCQALLDKSQSFDRSKQPESTIPAQAPPAAPPPAEAQTTPAPPGYVVAEPPTVKNEQLARRSRVVRTAGVIAAGLGGVALVTGVALNLKVNSLATDLEVPGAYSRSTESRRSEYATLAWIGYGVGGALLAGGVALYLLGRGSARTDAIALAPVFASDRVGAALMGAF